MDWQTRYWHFTHVNNTLNTSLHDATPGKCYTTPLTTTHRIDGEPSCHYRSIRFIKLLCIYVCACVCNCRSTESLSEISQEHISFLPSFLSSPLSPIIPLFLPSLLPYDSFHPDMLQHRTVIAACLPLVNLRCAGVSECFLTRRVTEAVIKIAPGLVAIKSITAQSLKLEEAVTHVHWLTVWMIKRLRLDTTMINNVSSVSSLLFTWVYVVFRHPLPQLNFQTKCTVQIINTWHFLKGQFTIKVQSATYPSRSYLSPQWPLTTANCSCP